MQAEEHQQKHQQQLQLCLYNIVSIIESLEDSAGGFES